MHIDFAIAEDDAVFHIVGVAHQAAERFTLLGRIMGRCDEALGDCRGGCGLTGGFDPDGIVQERIGDALDLGRHGGGEKQCLARERHHAADFLDVGDEPHIQHSVGFVDDEHFDAGEEKFAAFDVIEQTAGCCDQHVDAAGDFEILIAEGNTADEQGDIEFLAGAIAYEGFLDLGG